MTLKILAVLSLGLMCGSELNVAAFAQPTFNRQSLEVHILMRSSFAALIGQVMPFWMGASTLLNLLLLLPFEHLNKREWQFVAAAAAIQVVAVLFSSRDRGFSGAARSDRRWQFQHREDRSPHVKRKVVFKPRFHGAPMRLFT